MAYTDMSDGLEITKRLQAMLRALSKWTDDKLLGVAINGRYDEGTRSAVMRFQKKYFLLDRWPSHPSNFAFYLPKPKH